METRLSLMVERSVSLGRGVSLTRRFLRGAARYLLGVEEPKTERPGPTRPARRPNRARAAAVRELAAIYREVHAEARPQGSVIQQKDLSHLTLAERARYLRIAAGCNTHPPF
jgi:hypothetical protein